MSDYVLVVDVCNHEDYPCCGCSREEYYLSRIEAERLLNQGKIRILSTSPEMDKIEGFVRYLMTKPNLETKAGQREFEDKYFDIVAGMDYDETQEAIGEISKAVEGLPADIQGYLDDIWEIFWDTDWSDPDGWY